MFRPNQTAQLLSRTGRDIHAREMFDAPRAIQIAVVRLAAGYERTTVRADSSASRGAGEETVVDGKILVRMTDIKRDDRVIIRGNRYRVIAVHERFTTWGGLDHLEVDIQAAPE